MRAGLDDLGQTRKLTDIRLDSVVVCSTTRCIAIKLRILNTPSICCPFQRIPSLTVYCDNPVYNMPVKKEPVKKKPPAKKQPAKKQPANKQPPAKKQKKQKKQPKDVPVCCVPGVYTLVGNCKLSELSDRLQKEPQPVKTLVMRGSVLDVDSLPADESLRINRVSVSFSKSSSKTAYGRVLGGGGGVGGVVSFSE